MMLHDHLEDAVADVTADLPALTTASRKRGLGIRRRRRALATVGSVAAATALACTGYLLVPAGNSATDDMDATGPASVRVTTLTGKTAPLTGRGVVAALIASIDEVADGTFDHVQGSDPMPNTQPPTLDSDGSVRFQPDAAGGPAGLVMLNLQPIAVAGRPPYRCEGYLEDYLSDCQVTTLPNGDILRTYHEDGDTERGAGSQRYVAEVISPQRRMRVSVSAENSNPWVHDEFRDHAVLTTEQLTAIATQPWWDLKRLPVEYVEAGERLRSYEGPAVG